MDIRRASPIPLDSPKAFYKNYAGDAETARRAVTLALPMLTHVRRNRQTIDKKAFRRYNQWALVTDDRFYVGRANTYIPAVRRGVERLVSGTIRETFPSDEWWDVQATAPEFEKNLDGQRALLRQQLRQMGVKRLARPAYRQAFLCGLTPVRVGWKTVERTESAIGQGPEGKGFGVTTRRRVLYNGPEFEPVDFFSFGVYPMTGLRLEDALLVYEDAVVSLDELKADRDNYTNLARAKSAAGSGTSGSEALQQRQQRLRQLGITEDELTDGQFAFVTHCYLSAFDLKDSFRLGPEPVILTLAWEEIPIRLQRNAYGRAPYLEVRDSEMIGEHWPHARTEATDRLQIHLNDVSNQDADASSFANNPIVLVDPNVVEDYQAIAIYPGAKVPAPKDAVSFDRPPEAAYSQKDKLAFLHQLINENLGSPTASSGSPAASAQPRGARTFGGMQMLQMLAGSEAKEFVEFQEENFWEPLLGWMAQMNALFLSDEQTLRMAGSRGAAVVVNRETFAGDYAYEWLGTSTMQNQTVRSAQMLVFMNVLRGLQLPPGQSVNVAYILKTWWRSQGLKDADRVILDAAPESVPADLEHQLVALGRAIQVSPQDNDAEHIAAHARGRSAWPPESPEHQTLLQHEQAHYTQMLVKQQAAQLQPSGAMGGGTTNGGPAPAGAKAGMKPRMGADSGMGPARAMLAAPGGAPGGP